MHTNLLILLNILYNIQNKNKKRKNVYTKNIAIGYVAYVIFINFYTVIFHTNNGFFSVIANEIPKMVIQTILLSIFTVYFLVSKRVKYTFIEKEEKSNFENAKEEYLKEYNERKNISNK